MDDNKFDDIVKGKLDHFPDQPFDPAALADLHYKMAITTPLPWYIRYKAEILTAAAVIIILLFNGGLYYGLGTRSHNDYSLVKSELVALKETNRELLNLQKQLISESETAMVDTIVLESNNAALLYEIELLKNNIDRLLSETQKSYKRTEENIMFLGHENELSEELITSLDNKGLIRYQGEEVYLISNGNVPRSYPTTPNLLNSYLYDGSGIVYINSEVAQEEKKDFQMDLETKKELEKHYMKGIGIKIAPAVGALKTNYEVGAGTPQFTYGVLTDLILSPSLSLETGFMINSINNEIEGAENLVNLNKPGFDPSLGELAVYEIDSEMLEFPINLKYRYPISNKTFLTGSLGYTAMLYTKQQIEYEQLLDTGDPLGIINVSSGTTINSTEFSAGTANIALGLSTRIQKRNFLELTLQYRLGLAPMGVEEITPNLFGLRAAYWFHVR